MSNKFRFELNRSGVSELMKSAEMKSVLSDLANRVRNSVGEGYTTSVYSGRNRANASVHAESRKARKDNLKNNTLLKALGSLKG